MQILPLGRASKKALLRLSRLPALSVVTVSERASEWVSEWVWYWYIQEKEMRTKMDIEENIRDKMLVDEIVRKTMEEDEKFVIYVDGILN